MTLTAFPGKIPETGKKNPSPNVGPKPADQSQQLGSQKCIVISHQKSTAYRNKISLKLGYRAVNARKYVRCARTFYLFCLSILHAPILCTIQRYTPHK